MIYTLYCLPLVSNSFQKGLVESMIIDREFSNVEEENNKKFRKRHHRFDEDYYKTRFVKWIATFE